MQPKKRTDFTGYCCGGPWDGKWVAQPRTHFEVARMDTQQGDWWNSPQTTDPRYRTDFYSYDEFYISGSTDPIRVPLWRYQGKMPTSRQALAAGAAYYGRLKRGS